MAKPAAVYIRMLLMVHMPQLYMAMPVLAVGCSIYTAPHGPMNGHRVS